MCRIFMMIIFLISSFNLKAQIDKCNCDALIDINYKNKITVYSKPNGKAVKSFVHNFKEEDFLMLKINNDSIGFFHASVSYANKEKINTDGWIKKTTVIGTYARNYGKDDTLKLYSKPNLMSSVHSYIPEWVDDFYSITKCHNKWVYVKLKYKGQIKEGWLHPDNQCPNPYTTCN